MQAECAQTSTCASVWVYTDVGVADAHVLTLRTTDLHMCRYNAYSHLEFDLGNLSAYDPSPLEAEDFTPLNRSAKCLEVATAMTQALVSQLFALPSEAVQGGRLAQLPAPSTALPREKPIPKAKPVTKWQKFAQVNYLPGCISALQDTALYTLHSSLVSSDRCSSGSSCWRWGRVHVCCLEWCCCFLGSPKQCTCVGCFFCRRRAFASASVASLCLTRRLRSGGGGMGTSVLMMTLMYLLLRPSQLTR